MIPMQSQRCGLFSFHALPLPHATSACTATKEFDTIDFDAKIEI